MYLYLPLPIRIIPGLTGEGLFRHDSYPVFFLEDDVFATFSKHGFFLSEDGTSRIVMDCLKQECSISIV